MSKRRKQIFWAGFCGGQLMVDTIDDGFGGYGSTTRLSPSIFRTRREARKQFEDVRKVEISEVKP